MATGTDVKGYARRKVDDNLDLSEALYMIGSMV